MPKKKGTPSSASHTMTPGDGGTSDATGEPPTTPASGSVLHRKMHEWVAKMLWRKFAAHQGNLFRHYFDVWKWAVSPPVDMVDDFRALMLAALKPDASGAGEVNEVGIDRRRDVETVIS